MFRERGRNDYPDRERGRKRGYIKFALPLLALYIPLFLLSACGRDGNISSETITSVPSAETGSIHFNIEWQSTPISTSNSSIQPELALDCAAAGISTVEAKVYDETNSLLASGEWSCAVHSGTINDVKVGSNRTLVILGKDFQENNIFLGGPLGGITLLPNQPYNAGIITAIPYSISLVSPANDSSIVNCDFSFQWFGAVVGRFEIQLADSIDFASPIISQILKANSYTPANLNPGKYYWRVRAVDDLGNPSKWSETWTCTVEYAIGQPPSAPTGINAAAGDSQVIVSWNSDSGAASYNLYWSLSPGLSKVSYTEKISNVSSPFTHAGRINGTTYYYVVTAVNSCGESVKSNPISAMAGQPPSAPTGVNAAAGDSQVSISWNAASGAASYNLYWGTVAGVNKNTGTKIPSVTSPYIHTERVNGTTYYYIVTAQNGLGESSESTEVSATPGRPPSAPTGVMATAGNKQVRITWDNVTGATSYNIYWSIDPGVNKTNGTKISNITSPYIHKGLTDQTTYYYVVTAVNIYGESIESSQVFASTP